MGGSRSERADHLAALWARIVHGQAHIAACQAAGLPYDRSLAHLAGLKADYLAALDQPPTAEEEERASAVADAESPRSWGIRQCPACGTAHQSFWEPGSTVWCGGCAVERQRRVARAPARLVPRRGEREAV